MSALDIDATDAVEAIADLLDDHGDAEAAELAAVIVTLLCAQEGISLDAVIDSLTDMKGCAVQDNRTALQ